MKAEEIKLIEDNPVSFATVDDDGNPNVIPVAYVKVKDDRIVITDNYMKQTKENLEERSSVCLAVWDKDWKGIKVLGEATYFDSGEWLDYVKKLDENKGEPAKGAIVVEVIEIKELG